jgi:hypothetical protein
MANPGSSERGCVVLRGSRELEATSTTRDFYSSESAFHIYRNRRIHSRPTARRFDKLLAGRPEGRLMLVESLRMIFVKSIDHESYCVIDESPKLFAAYSFEEG